MSHPVVFPLLQAEFWTISQAPLCYWQRERFFDLLAGRTLGRDSYQDGWENCWPMGSMTP